MDKEGRASFTLPVGYVDSAGRRHRHGVMRACTEEDRILIPRDPRCHSPRERYQVFLYLCRSIEVLGQVELLSPRVLEALALTDLHHLVALWERLSGADLAEVIGIERDVLLDLAAGEAARSAWPGSRSCDAGLRGGPAGEVPGSGPVEPLGPARPVPGDARAEAPIAHGDRAAEAQTETPILDSVEMLGDRASNSQSPGRGMFLESIRHAARAAEIERDDEGGILGWAAGGAEDRLPSRDLARDAFVGRSQIAPERLRAIVAKAIGRPIERLEFLSSAQGDQLLGALEADGATVEGRILLPSTSDLGDPEDLGLLAHEATHALKLPEDGSERAEATAIRNETVARSMADAAFDRAAGECVLNSGPSRPQAGATVHRAPKGRSQIRADKSAESGEYVIRADLDRMKDEVYEELLARLREDFERGA